jgi:hypothetical protein
LEDLVNKDAAEQVNAAIRVLSAKCALGAKNTNREERQGPGKSKEEKKKKVSEACITGFLLFLLFS